MTTEKETSHLVAWHLMWTAFALAMSSLICWHFLMQGLDRTYAIHRVSFTKPYLVAIGPIEIVFWIAFGLRFIRRSDKAFWRLFLISVVVISLLNVVNYLAFSGLALI